MNAATIKLAQFLKWKGAVETGGLAKLAIQDGEVRVNGAIETRRGLHLRSGDQVEYQGETWVVELEEPEK